MFRVFIKNTSGGLSALSSDHFNTYEEALAVANKGVILNHYITEGIVVKDVAIVTRKVETSVERVQ